MRKTESLKYIGRLMSAWSTWVEIEKEKEKKEKNKKEKVLNELDNLTLKGIGCFMSVKSAGIEKKKKKKRRWREEEQERKSTGMIRKIDS